MRLTENMLKKMIQEVLDEEMGMGGEKSYDEVFAPLLNLFVDIADGSPVPADRFEEAVEEVKQGMSSLYQIKDGNGYLTKEGEAFVRALYPEDTKQFTSTGEEGILDKLRESRRVKGRRR